MEENYGKILGEGYGLRYYGGNRIRSGFLCKTNAGLREIKNASPKKESIQFEHDVKEHLYHKGFRHISRFCLSCDGRPYFQTEKNTFVLERPVEGQPMEEGQNDTFLQGVTGLAKLHKAGIGVQSAAQCSNLRQLPSLCQRRKCELLRIKKRIDKQGSYGALDVLLLQNFGYYIERIEMAEALFQTLGYEEAMKNAEDSRAICHNAFKGENLRRNDKGEIFITGFGKCAYDSPMTDLAAYLRRCIKKSEAADLGMATAMRMVTAYQEVLPMHEGDMAALLGILHYPDKFLRLINEYYNKRQVCVSPAMRERLQSCIASQKKNDELIKQLKSNFSI